MSAKTWPVKIAESRIRAHAVIAGDPISKQRPRFQIHKSGRVYTPKDTKEAERAIAWGIKAANRQLFMDEDSLFGVRAIFYCRDYQRKDVDNMMKLVLDACNGFIWKDDAQVAEIAGMVLRGERESKTEILIYIVPGVAHPKEICEICEKPFKIYKSWGLRRFCSQKCASLAQRNGIESPCAHYDKPVYRPKHMVKIGNARRFFCSVECRTMATTVQLSCAQCGKEFRRPRSLIKPGKHFCSEDCMSHHWRAVGLKKTYGICSVCGGATSKKSYVMCRACRIGTKVFRSAGQTIGWKEVKAAQAREAAHRVIPCA